MHNLDKRDMPLYLIILSLIVIFPLGIYFIVLKTENKLKNLKISGRILNILGLLFLIILVIYFIANYGYYTTLIDSHMDISMYDFSFIYVYIYLIMVTISLLVGGFYLNRKCEKFVIYTEFINVRHIKDINLIREETLEDLEKVKENIRLLIKKGYLINIKLVDDHIVSTKTVDKNDNLVKCKSCGNVKKLIKDTTRCDFCFRKLTKKDKI